jgi:hypothetical protein
MYCTQKEQKYFGKSNVVLSGKNDKIKQSNYSSYKTEKKFGGYFLHAITYTYGTWH